MPWILGHPAPSVKNGASCLVLLRDSRVLHLQLSGAVGANSRLSIMLDMCMMVFGCLRYWKV